ncbi:MAG: WG repeat-containing protein [Chitinophagales bacterium]|nr:WG repeat-containing protein [Chitinophagales bacterium]
MKNCIIYLLILVTICKAFSGELPIPYIENGKVGFCDTTGKVLQSPSYEKMADIDWMYNLEKKGPIIRYLMVKDSNYYIVDENLKIVLKPHQDFDSVALNWTFSSYDVFKNGKAGMYANGKIVVPCLYDEVSQVSDSRFEVKLDGLTGLVDDKGKQIIPIEYRYIYEDARIGNVIKWAAKGQIIQEYFYDTIPTASMVELDGPIAMLGGPGPRMKIPMELENHLEATYHFYRIFTERYICVENDGQYGIYDAELQIVCVPLMYEKIGYLGTLDQKSLFKVKQNGLEGIVNQDNGIELAIYYEDVNYNGRDVILWKNQQYGVCNLETKRIIEPQYQNLKFWNNFRMNENDYFSIYYVTKCDNKGFVGENGVEYFK